MNLIHKYYTVHDNTEIDTTQLKNYRAFYKKLFNSEGKLKVQEYYTLSKVANEAELYDDLKFLESIRYFTNKDNVKETYYNHIHTCRLSEEKSAVPFFIHEDKTSYSDFLDTYQVTEFSPIKERLLRGEKQHFYLLKDGSEYFIKTIDSSSSILFSQVYIYNKNTELMYEFNYDKDNNFTDGYDFVNDKAIISLYGIEFPKKEDYQIVNTQKILAEAAYYIENFKKL